MMLPSLKRCSKCGETKSCNDFAIERARKDGRKYWCRLCCKGADAAWFRSVGRAKKYGLTEAERVALFDRHDGRCWFPSCVSTASDTDHDHETDTVRGALCHGHNMGLGALGDNVEGLIEALQYLLAAA